MVKNRNNPKNAIVNNVKNQIINNMRDNMYGPDRVRIILIIMIKNESQIIKRALESVEEFVDAMCVCDTGSTDNTVEIVKEYFKTLKKPSKLYQHKWENFGHNRSLSFTDCAKFCKDLKWRTNKTYGLLLDADQKLVFNEYFNKEDLDESGYNLKISSEWCFHYVPKLVNLSKNWKCIGSTHEYWIEEGVNNTEGYAEIDEDDLYIEDIGDGGCKSDKYERDIKLLTQDLKKNPNDSRSIYYLGQSHYDLKQYDEAINWLKKRLLFHDVETDDEEYKSLLRIAISLQRLNKPENIIHEAFMRCIDKFPFMLEPIHYLMNYYIDAEKWDKAFEVGKLGLNVKLTDDIPFLTEFPIYDYKFKDDMLLACIESKNYAIGLKVGMELLKEKKYDREDKDRIRNNYYTCMNKLVEKDLSHLPLNYSRKINDSTAIGVLNYYQCCNLGDSYQSSSALYVWWLWFGKPHGTFKSFLEVITSTNQICDVPVIWLDRDGMSETVLPDGIDRVIILGNAWWMNSKEDSEEFDFPLPDFIDPIFVSMHISNKNMLTENAVNYLKKHQPIGCRDYSTMKELQSKGVEAYFSGCLTSCLNLLDQELGFKVECDYKNEYVLVDVKKENVDKKYQFNDYTYLTQITHDFLDDNTYFIKAVQRQYDILYGKKVLTNRLHTWVPLIFNNGDTDLLNPNKNYELYKVTDGDFRYPDSNRFNGMLEEGLKSWDERKLFRETLTNNTLELIKQKLNKN